jgi:hypothetical protein
LLLIDPGKVGFCYALLLFLCAFYVAENIEKQCDILAGMQVQFRICKPSHSIMPTKTTINSEPVVKMLSRRQLSERWAISRETLKRRERAGVLPFFKLGRDARYLLADIERLEKEAEVRL